MTAEVKRVARLRGTTAQLALVAGQPGELIVDTDRNTVTVHDGGKLGGYPLLREDGDGSAVTVVPDGAAYARSHAAMAGDTTNVLAYILPGYHAAIRARTFTGDLTAAIQAALNRRGRVYLPPGRYPAASDLIVRSGTTVFGAGVGATEVVTTIASQNGFRFFDGVTETTGSSIRDMSITSPSPTFKTAGAAVVFDQSTSCEASNLRIDNQFVGVRLRSSFILRITGVCVWNLKPGTGTGFLLDGPPGTNSDHYMRDCFVGGDLDPAKTPGDGFLMEQTGATWMDGCGALFCGRGLVLAPKAGQEVAHLFTSRCAFDTCRDHCWVIAPAPGGQVKRCMSSQDWACGSQTGHGVHFAPSGGVVHGYEFAQLRLLSSAQNGATLENGEDIRFIGGMVMGNGKSSPNTFDGIRIAAGVSRFSVQSMKIGYFPDLLFPSITNAQRYGVMVEPGASDRYTIAGNDLTGNLTGSLSDGGTGTDKHVHSNVGVSAGFRQTGAGLIGGAGQALKVGMKAATPHQVGNVGSVGLTVEDGGGESGIFVENIHDGTFSSQRVVIRTSWGGVVGTTDRLTVEKDGAITNGSATLFDGGGVVCLRSFTVGTVPSAAIAGQQVYVSNESGGAVVAFSDGSNWRRVTDRAVIS